VIGHQHRKSPTLVEIDEVTGCWQWLGAAGGDSSKTGKTYGTMRFNGRYVRAHRHYYERYRGPIPEGMVLDHLCRNTLCVNPDHLEAVTQIENVRRGDATRLTDRDVREARRMRAIGMTVTAIAEHFNYPNGPMSNLLNGKVWKLTTPAVTG
jgi:hypothetical protein